MKPCTRCKETKPLSEFYRQTRGWYYSHCKKCHGVMTAKNSRTYSRKYKHTAWYRKSKYLRRKRDEAKHRYKQNARRALAVAIGKGLVRKPKRCSKASKLCGGVLQGHHPDYSKPLEVIWLCNNHHQDLHRVLRNQLTNQQYDKVRKIRSL